MASLNGQTIASSYEQLLHVDRDGGGNANTLVSVKDGDNGTTFGIKLATNKVEIIPGSNDTNAFEVSQADGTAVLTVDSTNAQVGIGISSSLAAGAKLHVKGNDGANYIHIESANDNNYLTLGTFENDQVIIAYGDTDTGGSSALNFYRTTSAPFGGSSLVMSLDSSGDVKITNSTNFGSSTGGALEILSTNAGDVGAVLSLFHESPSTASNDFPAIIRMYGRDGNDNKTEMGNIGLQMTDSSESSEDAEMKFGVISNASLGSKLILRGTESEFYNDVIVGASNGSNEVKVNRARMRHLDGLADASDYSHGDLFLNHISSGVIKASSQMQGIDGSVSAPSYAFQNDTNMGMYRAADNILAFSTGGTQALKVSGSGVVFGEGDLVNAQFEMRKANDGGGVNLAITNQAGGVSSSTNETTAVKFYHGKAGTSALGTSFSEMGNITVGRESTNQADNSTHGFMAFHTTSDDTIDERMRINRFGNVGIGDNNPDEAKLSIDSVQSGDAGLKIHNDQATSGIEIDQDGNNSAIYIDAENTTANTVEVHSDSLTTGNIALFSSNSTSNSTRTLVKIHNDSNQATGATLLTATQDANADSIQVDAIRSDLSSIIMTLTATGRAPTQNFTSFRCTTGASGGDIIHNLRGDGVTQNSSGTFESADYAEYFESKDGKAIPVGTTVKFDGNKIVPCKDGDNPFGVVRPQGASLVGNSAWASWDSKYLKDDYGAYVLEEYTITEWVDENGDDKDCATDMIPENTSFPNGKNVLTKEEDGTPLMRRKLNPDWDESKTYVSREDRDEWNIVGLLGQVQITKDQPVASNWIKMKDISDTVELWFIK